MAATKAARTREKPQLIADELRALIVSGALADGESLGHEPDLVERFGVSRPSLREALRILEAEGLVSVVRGVRGGVVAHAPNGRMTARTAALVLQARGVTLADVFQARSVLEPAAAHAVATMRGRRGVIEQLRVVLRDEEAHFAEPEQFALANAAFHQQLVSLVGNQTLGIVAEMLNEIVDLTVAALSRDEDVGGSPAVRRRSLRAQERLLELLAAGDAPAAEAHWRTHLQAVGRVVLGSKASSVVDLLDQY